MVFLHSIVVWLMKGKSCISILAPPPSNHAAKNCKAKVLLPNKSFNPTISDVLTDLQNCSQKKIQSALYKE